MLEDKLIKTFKEYLDNLGKEYNVDADLKELVEIARKCNPSAPDTAFGRIFRHALNS